MGAGKYKALSHKEFLAGQGLRYLVVVMGGNYGLIKNI